MQIGENEAKVESDILIAGDKRTMEIIQSRANDIDAIIQASYAIPSNHSDNMVPILDVKAKVDE